MLYLIPFAASILWAICYAYMEDGLQGMSIATMTFFTSLAGVFTALFIIPALGGEGVSIKPLLNKRLLFALIMVIITARLADYVVIYATQNISATYAAFAEVAYPVFIPIVIFLIFGHNQISTHTLIGGALVLAGIYTLFTGEYLKNRTQQREDLFIAAKIEKIEQSAHALRTTDIEHVSIPLDKVLAVKMGKDI